jgi:c-di-GMP-related signal transduction protein
LPEGLRFLKCNIVSFKEGEKKPASLMSLFTGSQYELFFVEESGKKTVMDYIKNNNSIDIIKDKDLTATVNHFINHSKGFVTLMKELFAGPYFEFVKINKVKTFLKEDGPGHVE